MKDDPKQTRSSSIPGIGLIGCVTTGVAGLVHPFIYSSGLGLIAAAISFGIIVYVSYR